MTRAKWTTLIGAVCMAFTAESAAAIGCGGGSYNSANTLSAVEHSTDAIEVSRGLLGISTTAVASAASHFTSSIVSILSFAAAVELDKDASVGRQTIQNISRDNQETGNQKGSAGHYGRSVGFSEADMSELGL